MTENERSFRRVMNKIGIAMLLFLAIINVSSTVHVLFSSVLGMIFEEETAYVITELGYCVMYLSSFIAPGLILMAMLGKDRTPLMFDKKVPRDAAPYILATITVAYAFAYLNSYLVSIFDYSAFSSEYLWGGEPMTNTGVVLSFIGTAMVPAFCEEFLFRGAILSALKPYGKAPAVIISAVLFGLMHQNAEQLLYTTVAGLMMGYVVYETGSVWCSVLIHFFNNFISVLESVLIERVEMSCVNYVVSIFEGVLFLLGIVSIVYLIVKKLKEKSRLPKISDGFFGKDLESLGGDCVKVRLPAGKITKLFFAPTVIVFIALSGATVILYLILSLIYKAGGSIPL